MYYPPFPEAWKIVSFLFAALLLGLFAFESISEDDQGEKPSKGIAVSTTIPIPITSFGYLDSPSPTVNYTLEELLRGYQANDPSTRTQESEWDDFYYDDPSDLDCEDIGQEIWVGDDDPNGLDRDGDGWGCEGW
jgi:hypothetical protein